MAPISTVFWPIESRQCQLEFGKKLDKFGKFLTFSHVFSRFLTHFLEIPEKSGNFGQFWKILANLKTSIQNLRNLGFSGMIGMSKRFNKIENDLNEMFYGCVPFKLKKCIITGSPWWLSMLLSIYKFFLSKKMASRIINVSLKNGLEMIGGSEKCPEGYLGGTGKKEERF